VLSQPRFSETSSGISATGDESAGLRYRLIRLRLALRYANEPRVEAILREVIEHIESRLEQLGQ